MVKLIREILVLPLRLLLLVSRFVPVVDRYVLVKWIWKVGRCVDDGCLFVGMAVERDGLETGRGLAHEMLEETKSAKIVYIIAWREMAEKNYDAVKGWVDLVEEIGCEDLYHMLIIKLRCSLHFEDGHIGKIIEEILACNYLPMDYTREALIGKTVCLMREEEFESAEKIIDHMLSVKDGPSERFIKAKLCLMRNDDRNAEKHFSKSKGSLSDESFFAVVGRTYVSCQRVQEGFKWLDKAVEAGYKVSKEDEYLWDVIHSNEFADYCAMRN